MLNTIVNTTMSVTWSLILALPLVMLGLSWLGLSWRWLQRLLAAGVLLALVSWAGVVWTEVASSASTLALANLQLTNLVNITALSATLLLLILFLALIVLRYAATNFEGDARQQQFLQGLLLTVFAVMVTVASNHLLVLWLGWMGISLSLHRLLMFYPERPRAALAAHKKFILARVAELLLASAFVLLYSQHHTLVISDILAQYPKTELHWQEQLAAVLLAMVALIKCAQLPVHGWLIQVVEAPTPVSALLHAGVINLGGFLLLLFAPLFSQVMLAQSIVLVIAGLSTVVAALIMMTRISIKVRLAWSTTTQMGLMLVECALGLYELALLHLLAHSCYKAYAFLTAGEAVNHHLQQTFVAASLPKFRHYGTATLIVLGMICGLLFAVSQLVISQEVELAPQVSPWLLIGIALVMLLATRFNQCTLNLSSGLQSIGLVAAVLLAYLVLKTLTSFLLPNYAFHYVWLADAWISILFLGLWAVYLFLQHFPTRALSQRLFIALNAGLYLDEWATRYTLLLWPIRLPRTTQKVMSDQLELAK